MMELFRCNVNPSNTFYDLSDLGHGFPSLRLCCVSKFALCEIMLHWFDSHHEAERRVRRQSASTRHEQLEHKSSGRFELPALSCTTYCNAEMVMVVQLVGYTGDLLHVDASVCKPVGDAR